MNKGLRLGNDKRRVGTNRSFRGPYVWLKAFMVVLLTLLWFYL